MNTRTTIADIRFSPFNTNVAKGSKAPLSRKKLWAGRILSAIPFLMLFSGAINVWMKSPQVLEGMARLGYPETVGLTLGILELVCAVLYVIPRTAFLGALLMTAYLGGATASHVRIGDPAFFAPVMFGVIVWAGLYCRDPRVGEMLRAPRE